MCAVFVWAKVFDSLNQKSNFDKPCYISYWYFCIKSLLSNRSYFVKLEEAISSYSEACSGVPKCLSFLWFSNGLMFADNVKLVSPRLELQSLEYSLSISWALSEGNQLRLNGSNTNHMALRHHIVPLQLQRGPNGTSLSIAKMNSCKGLGAYINLSFTPTLHCQSAVKKYLESFFICQSLKEQ